MFFESGWQSCLPRWWRRDWNERRRCVRVWWGAGGFLMGVAVVWSIVKVNFVVEEIGTCLAGWCFE